MYLHTVCLHMVNVLYGRLRFAQQPSVNALSL